MSSESGLCGTLQEPNNNIKDEDQYLLAAGANGDAAKAIVQNRQQSDNNSSEIAAVGCFPLSCDCVVELDIVNYMERDANVSLQSEVAGACFNMENKVMCWRKSSPLHRCSSSFGNY